jgi:hypothetical protein
MPIQAGTCYPTTEAQPACRSTERTPGRPAPLGLVEGDPMTDFLLIRRSELAAPGLFDEFATQSCGRSVLASAVDA